MISNEYSTVFRSEPLTIRDRALDLARFLQVKERPAKPLMELRHILPESLVSKLILMILQKKFSSILDSSPESSTLQQAFFQSILQHSPSTFCYRNLIGIAEVQARIIHHASSYKPTPIFDEDGNKSLLTMILVLDPGMITPDHHIKCQTPNGTFTYSNLEGLCLLVDNKTVVHYPPVKKGILVLLEIKLLYNMLPNNCSTLSEDDQLILWRGLMKKPFLNTFGYPESLYSIASFLVKKDQSHRSSPRPASPIGQWSLQTIEDPLKEQCESCLAFIPIESETCPQCSDKLVPIPHVIQSRKKGIWMSNS